MSSSTDIDNTNVMDDTPFWQVDLSNKLSGDDMETFRLFIKEEFNLDEIIAVAEKLKYVNVMKVTLKEQLSGPRDEIVRILTPPNGRIDKFRPFAAQAIDEVLREYAVTMLASSPSAVSAANDVEEKKVDEETHSATDGIFTTAEELEAFEIVKSILQGTIDESRLSLHDTQSYCNVIVDGKRRNFTVCRFNFKETVNYLDTADAEGNFTTNQLASMSDIGDYTEALRTRAAALALR